MKLDKIVLITQYYKVKNNDLKYMRERQAEIDFCLKKNCENPWIHEIHLLVEMDEVDLKFIKKNTLKK